jgi:predicted amidohydrolase YtcJ
MVADRPVRVQHRSGAVWSLNSEALARVGLLQGDVPAGCEVDEKGRPTGRLYRLDEWLRARVPKTPLELAAVGRALAAEGVTGVTDATPWATQEPIELLAAAVEARTLPLRITVMGAPSLEPSETPASLIVGPAKLLLPDHDLPSLDEITVGVREARAHGRTVAVHCVTRSALVLALAALEEVGTDQGDRIEHAAVVGPDLLTLMRRAGVTVVTQPNFVAERGDDYLAEVSPEDQDHLWPCASLLNAGLPVGAGTDAPFGRPDPWAMIHAAATRRSSSGAEIAPAERVSARVGLGFLLSDSVRPGGDPRRIEVGAPADLCLLHGPLEIALSELPTNPVRATIAAGMVVHQPGD